jgi:hypothetical protein
MSSTKEIDLLAKEIADVLGINPDSISLSKMSGGFWMADVSNLESELLDSPIKVMQSLLTKANDSVSTC